MKNITSFVSGAAIAALIMASTVPALALSGKLTYGEAGISLFGTSVIPVGSSHTSASGEEIPDVITYTGGDGGKINYVAVRSLAEMFDIPGIEWDSASSTVEFAPPSDFSDIDITVGSESAPAADVSDTPTYGTSAGPFTEVDPSTVNTDARAVYHLDGMTVVSKTGFTNQTIDCQPGNTIVLTVTNNGDTVQYLNVCRRPAINYGVENFDTVKVLPGKTAVRAFTLSDAANELTREIEWGFDGSISEPAVTDLTVSVVEYV